MPRDYAKHSPRKRKPSARGNTRTPAIGRIPGWAWMLVGLFLGILLMSLVRFWEDPHPDIAKAIKEITNTKTASKQKPRFDFYTLLRESEVIVPDMEQNPLRGSHDLPVVDSLVDDMLLLQAGSFKDAGDADSLRVRLLLLNMDVRVETAGVGSGDTWHRVLVGPFQSPSKLANARAALLQNGIDSIVLKRKH